jgi:acyl transferase domain-containing protein/alpha-ketoglutarate-dependent taurine dioxygenase/acyl carrier protein
MSRPQDELLDGVAIVGLACRFPGARNADEFWRNLAAGVESVTVFSDEELLAAGVDAEVLRDPGYVKAAPVLQDIDLFDAGLFGYSPREAELMDPQQRIFLECAWEALENAGYDSETCRERIGVYAGVRLDTYWLGLYDGREAVHAPDALQALIGNDKDYLATQVSYRLNLRGPSIGVQTACSTALVAVSLASQGLLGYQCDLALAGGVTVRVPQTSGYFYRAGGIASPDGHCRAFSADAQGSVFGSGAGIVVLKRLDDALRDGDHVRAVIRGTALNNDGALKVGYTAPSEEGQAEVIATAQAIAGVSPESITLVEAHGTGTTLGDPIEFAALQRVFRSATRKKAFCALGSVKTNIGHLDCAAGVAGLIKTTLALENGQIPPSLNFREPNPAIDLANSPFYVSTELRPWVSEGPRRAGVSSFGIGGTNAHAVLEEAPPAVQSGPARPWQVLPLSARTPAALEEATRNLAAHLRSHPELPIADVAFTLQTGRRALRHRRVVLCRDAAEAAAALESLDPQRVWTGREDRRGLPAAFLFPGQGAQYAGMGLELYREEPAFRAEIDHCAEVLRPHLGLDLREILFPPAGGEEEAGRRLEETALAQPALFAVEHSLARLWMSWGLHPQALAGHSVGEYVAACLAGVFSLEDGLALVAARGRLMQEQPPGAMLAVSLPEPELLGTLPAEVSVAAVNAPALCVVSGPADAVAELDRTLAVRGIGTRRLHTSHAFHSVMMEPALEPFAAELRRIRLSPPRLPVLSNLTGTWLTDAEATDPGYWTAHLRRTVRFSDNLRELLAGPVRVLLEVGPGRSLSTLARQHAAAGEGPAVLTSLRHAKDGTSDLEHLTAAVGRLWLAGSGVDWNALHAGGRRRRVPLPSYPFERQRYWLDALDEPKRPSKVERSRGLEDWFQVPVWRQSVLPPLEAAPPAGWLVFEDSHGIAAGLAARLRRDGRKVVSVRPGERFAAAGEDLWTIDPRRSEDYGALLAAVGTLDGVLHAWSVGEEEADPLDRGFYSLLFLAQALAAAGGEERVQLRVITSGVQSVTGDEPLQPTKAAVLGACAVIPIELPRLACQGLDIALPAPGREAALLDRLWEELAIEPVEPVLAYRGGRRWVRAFEPLRLGGVKGDGRLRDRGVYLVTGGWGGIGFALARDLAKTRRARLVLIGRSPAPEAKVRELEELGAEVLAVTADVTHSSEMEAAVRLALERFGTIHGAIHAAGVAGGGLLRLKTREAAERVLAPKVRGAAVLAQALRGLDLDFLVLFSSTIGLTGAFGQIDYSAANAVLDTFALDRAARGGGFTLAIDWDGWRDVGMTAQPSESSGTGAGHSFRQTRIAGTPEREVFAARLDADADWVLAEHRVMGHPVLPGTAYLELAHALAARRAGSRAVELRDVTFLSPLVVRNGAGIEIRAVIGGNGDGGPLRVFSRPEDAGEEAWEEHVACHVSYVDPGSVPQGPFVEITRGARVVDLAAGGEEDERARYMGLGPRWDTVRRVEVGDGEALTVLELPEAFAADLDRFGLHPALLDRATSFAIRYLAAGYYLPLGYRRLTVRGTLPRKVFSHLRLRNGDPAAQGGTLTFDLRLLDEHGEERVGIEGFSVRRIEDVEVLRQALSAPAVPARDTAVLGGAGAPAPGPRGIDVERGLEAFRRLVAWGGAPQVAVSSRDMAAALAEARAFGERAVLQRLEKSAADASKAAHPRPDLQVPYVAPRDETERVLAGIWQKLLGIEPIGVEDDFFELGGHSLLAIRLTAELRAALGIELPARDLFETPTVAGLASRVQAAQGTTAAPAIVPVPRDGDLPLSFAQERQWFLAQLEPDSPLYNHAAGLRLSGELAVSALEESLDEIRRRHESFRSTFVAMGGRPVQRVAPPCRQPLPLVDLSALPRERGEDEAARIGSQEARRPFDLARGPLLRVILVRLAGREHTAWFVLHHIAGDHWSAGVLIRELAALYGAFAAGRPSPLPEPPIQYADFAHWQRRWLSGDVLAAELGYWRQRLGGRLPALELPTTRPRPAVQSPRGASQPFELSPDLSEGVRTLARREGATPFMVLLAALKTLLHHLARQEDIIVGAPVAGRDRPELDGLIGYFINALALRTDLSGDPSFRELLGRVRTVTLGAFAHQDLPFEKLVEELKPERRPGYSPIFQVVFNYQNAAPAAPVELPGLTVRTLAAGRGTAKYDFTLYMWEAADRLAGAFEYKTDLFDAAAMARVRDEFVTILERTVAIPEVRLSALHDELSTRETEKRMIRQEEANSSNLKKLKITKRRAVNLSQEDLIRTEYLQTGPLPLVVRPNLDDVDLAGWAERNTDFLDRELMTHGGILFRGFAVPSAAAFERFVNCVTPDLVNYVEGSSPRIMVGDKVYTSTEYPPEFFVSMHNELSYAHKWPSKIFFYCHTAPQQGGETPIADSRKVWQRIDPEIRRKFEEKGVLYTRNLHGDRGVGLSWQTVFETTDREAVEAYCREGGIEFHWKEDGGLTTRQVRRATLKHPKTGEPVWFNQVDQWHPSNLGAEIAAALLATTREEELPINAYFGDGTPLDPAELDQVRQAFRETMVAFPWQQGDVLMLDNTLTAHGRMPFTPPRRVLVAMGGGVVRMSELAE